MSIHHIQRVHIHLSDWCNETKNYCDMIDCLLACYLGWLVVLDFVLFLFFLLPFFLQCATMLSPIAYGSCCVPSINHKLVRVMGSMIYWSTPILIDSIQKAFHRICLARFHSFFVDLVRAVRFHSFFYLFHMAFCLLLFYSVFSCFTWQSIVLNF